MTKQTFTQKSNGDTLEASEWNSLTSYVNTAVDAINAIPTNTGGNSGSSGEGLPNLYINSKGNLNLETSAELGNTSKGKINIEAIDDIQLKPGDDISLYSHHRADTEELSIKVLNGAEISPTDNAKIEEYPVDLQLNTSNIVLTTKDKDIYISEKNKARAAEGKDDTRDKANILNVEVKTGVKAKKATASNGQYGYLKVRGQAIDIRCEDHGGIALQPKGYDSDGNMNKIKFEHGGGDGLEFGTFNTEKSSLFTDEYRFNKAGIIKLATRTTEASGKTDDGVFDNAPDGKTATNALKYVKQADDFYDIISDNDPQCTWGDIINLVNSLRNYELVFECQHSISDYDITYSPNVPGSASYSDLVDGNIYTKEQLQSRYLYNESFDNLKEGQIIELNIHDDSEDPNDQVVACGFIVHQRYNSNKVTLEDIITVVEYFKNNNTTGPFASN